MTRDIIEINDFIILVEEAFSDVAVIDACSFDEPAIGIAFYGAGDVDVTVRYGDHQKEYKHAQGLALSFYADEEVVFEHHVSADKPLKCIVVVTSIRNLQILPNQEGEIFDELLKELTHPSGHYVEGPRFYMSPSMQTAVDKFFSVQYEGKTKMMFFRSQITELLSHFFGELASRALESEKIPEREKLLEAKEILSSNMHDPPSLSELSRQIGLNSFKLKKHFKELFGVPVFKYLQNERMTKAYDLLKHQDVSIQEAAWQVGYDSLSSFSNAFSKKFGYRPSEIRK